MGKNDMPRRRQFRTEEAYERAKRRYIAEMRRRKRRLRKIVKTAILALMAVTALLVCMGIGIGIKALVTSFGAKSVSESVLAKRYEVMPDISDVDVVEKETPAPSLDLSVCLDPGHGGIDPGTSSADGSRKEKDDALALGLATRDELTAMGAKVIMTREDDSFPSLGDRGYIANQAGVDVFVSLHRNAVDVTKSNSNPQGIEIFVSTRTRNEPDGSFELGEAIMREFEEVGISENRGVRYGSQESETSDYQVNRDTSMTSCLIEMGFMTNDKDNQLLDEHLKEYAKAIANAIVETCTDAEPTEPPKGMILENEKIQDINTLNNEEVVWGPGSKTDENNIPVGAQEFQKKYGSYQTRFIMPDAPKELYLTFDTGYKADYTEQILNILKERGISGVFFVTLPFVKSNEALVQRMIDEGHIIGNHSSYNPKEGIVSKSIEEQREDVKEMHEYMLNHFHYRMCLFRFPNGIFSQQSLAMINNLNYQSVFWSFSYDDYDEAKQPKTKNALGTLTERLHDGAIYLLSSRSQTNAQILDDFITQAQEAGYTFGTYSVKSTASDNTDSSQDGSGDDTSSEDSSQEGEAGGEEDNSESGGEDQDKSEQ